MVHPIESQGDLGSCSEHAAIGIVEYFERRAFGKHLDGSRLFVYKTTRNLIGVTGDTGAWLRNAMGALVIRVCGATPGASVATGGCPTNMCCTTSRWTSGRC